MCLFLNLLVLDNHKLLNSHHLVAETLNSDKLVIRLGALNLVENFEYLMVLVLHFDQAQFLLLVFAHIGVQLTRLLDFIERFDKLVSKALNPINVLVLDLD